MGICFIIEDSKLNEKNTIDFMNKRIATSLQIDKSEIISSSDDSLEYGIYKLSREDGTILYIEIYRINEEYKYFINIECINENEKNKLMELLSTDRLFENTIILMDSLSNNYISKQYYNFILFEQHLKQYFSFKLLDRYGSRAYDIINSIKTRESLIEFPSNIHINLQKIELNNLIQYILDKPLGGLEYEIYSNKYNSNDLAPLKSILKEDIFSDLYQNLHDNKKLITEYRNIICHNRFLNCNVMENKHVKTIDSLSDKLIKINNDYFKNLYSSNYDMYKKDNEKNNIFTFAINIKNGLKYNELLLIDILCKLDIVYNSEGLTIENQEKAIYKYESNNEGIKIYIKQATNDIENENLYFVVIEFSNISNLNDVILNKLNLGDIIVLYDSLSITNSLKLAGSFTVLENLFRSYVTLFRTIEEVEEINKKDNMIKELRIGESSTIMNSIYDLNFIDLLTIINAPNGGKNMRDLIKKLKTEIKDNNNEKIEFLLNNMLDYNNELGVIVKHWCELYKFRTLVAHCGIVLEKDCKNISTIIKLTRLTIENILADYISSNTKMFKNNEKIEIEGYFSVAKNVMKQNKYDITLIKNNNGQKQVLKIDNLYTFRANQIISKIANEESNSLKYIFSFEHLKDIIEKNKESIIEFIENDVFENNISNILDELGLDDYGDFRIISTQEQALEERIGELLTSLHSKIAKSKLK